MSFLNTDALLAALGNLDGTTDHVLTRLAGGKVTWAAAPGAAGGETNTASNLGAGVGVYETKVTADLQFNSLVAASDKITITEDDANDEIDFDVAEANLTLDNLGGTLAISKGGTGETGATAAFDALGPGTTKGDLLVHNGTDHIRLGVGTNTHVLTADSAEASGVKWAAGGGAGGGLTLVGPKGSDQSAITSTTLADITGLTFSASANTNYYLRVILNWSSTNSTEGVRLAINGPTGTYSYWGLISENDSNQDGDGFAVAADQVISCNSGTASNERFAILEGLVQVGGSGGTIAARVAAETGSGASVTIHEESFMVYQEITT